MSPDDPKPARQSARRGKGARSKKEYYTAHERTRNTGAKMGIAKYVVEHIIKPGRISIFLDAGSSVQYVAEELFRTEARTALSATMLTNNLGIFNVFNGWQDELRGGHTLVLLLTGGTFDANHDALWGHVAEASLQRFFPHLTIVGTSGFKFDEGLFYHGDSPEWLVKRAVCTMPTRHRVIVCDHTKMGERDAFQAISSFDLMNECQQCTVVTSLPPDGPEAEQYISVLRDQEMLFRELKENLSPDGTLGDDRAFEFVIVDKSGQPAQIGG